MTVEQFDNYRFTIKTKAKHHGLWVSIVGVNFGDRKIGIASGQYLDYSETEVKES